jgi:beta-galactosidase
VSRYDAVIVPSQYLITQAGIDNLTRYVDQGGSLVVTYFSGIVDEDDHLHPGMYPGAFASLLGVAMEEFFPLLADEQVELTRFGPGRVFSEFGTVTTAEVLAAYASGPTTQSPAVTRRSVGKGVAYYVGTALDRAGIEEFLELVDIAQPPAFARAASDDVEIVSRNSGDQSWVFVINHGTQPTHVEISGVELLSNSTVDGSLLVEAGRVAVVRVATS